jgi:hypothetical protein
MSKTLRINTQQIDYNIHILINNKYTDKDNNCFSNCKSIPGMRLNRKEISILENLKLFKIEYYGDKVSSNSRSRSNSNTRSKSTSNSNSENTITKKTKLLNSIHKGLCPSEPWLHNCLQNSITQSAFTIFINANHSSSKYYPLCIATISKKIYFHEYDGYDGDDNYKYFYVNTFCGSINYKRCGYHLMNTIKMIAYYFGYKYVKLISVINPKTLTWYRSQGFVEEDPHSLYSSHEFYYEIINEDQYYNRSEIKGECKIVNPSSPEKCISSSYTRSNKPSKQSNPSKQSKTRKPKLKTKANTI